MGVWKEIPALDTFRVSGRWGWGQYDVTDGRLARWRCGGGLRMADLL